MSANTTILLALAVLGLTVGGGWVTAFWVIFSIRVFFEVWSWML